MLESPVQLPERARSWGMAAGLRRLTAISALKSHSSTHR